MDMNVSDCRGMFLGPLNSDSYADCQKVLWNRSWDYLPLGLPQKLSPLMIPKSSILSAALHSHTWNSVDCSWSTIPNFVHLTWYGYLSLIAINLYLYFRVGLSNAPDDTISIGRYFASSPVLQHVLLSFRHHICSTPSPLLKCRRFITRSLWFLCQICPSPQLFSRINTLIILFSSEEFLGRQQVECYLLLSVSCDL